MPCLAMHIAIAKEYLKKHPNENKEKFIEGSIAPDLSDDKNKSHYGKNYNTLDAIEYLKNKVNIDDFLRNRSIENSYDKAYLLHLLSDKMFYDDLVSSGKLKGRTVDNIRKTIMDDYNRLTIYLVKKYNLEIPNNIKSIIFNEVDGELQLFEIKKIDEFIKKVSNIDIDEYAKNNKKKCKKSTSIEQTVDIKFMKEALKEAKKAYEKKEVPIGAIIVCDGKIIARGHNEKEEKRDVTKHAEITAIKRASKKLNNWRLNNCTMYVTLKPCNMCTGAIIQSRISKVVIGTEYESKGTIESHGIGSCEFDKKTEVLIGILENECTNILKNFFKQLR